MPHGSPTRIGIWAEYDEAQTFSEIGRLSDSEWPVRGTLATVGLAPRRAYHAVLAVGREPRPDGGEHWTSSRTPDGLSLYEMDFVDPDRGWAILHPAVGTALDVYATVDGGQTWQRRGTLASPANVVIPATFGSSRRLQFSGAQHGIFEPALGVPGALMTTGDGGQTWQRVDLPPRLVWPGRPV